MSPLSFILRKTFVLSSLVPSWFTHCFYSSLSQTTDYWTMTQWQQTASTCILPWCRLVPCCSWQLCIPYYDEPRIRSLQHCYCSSRHLRHQLCSSSQDEDLLSETTRWSGHGAWTSHPWQLLFTWCAHPITVTTTLGSSQSPLTCPQWHKCRLYHSWMRWSHLHYSAQHF